MRPLLHDKLKTRRKQGFHRLITTQALFRFFSFPSPQILTVLSFTCYEVVLQKLVAKWTNILDARDLSLEQLKGTMTNKVYACQWERDNGNRPRKMLIHVYGGANDLFFNRAYEVLTFERMSQKNQGPCLLGHFPNSRVEEFLRAWVSVLSLPFLGLGVFQFFWLATILGDGFHDSPFLFAADHCTFFFWFLLVFPWT
jgi:hypothetical protein